MQAVRSNTQSFSSCSYTEQQSSEHGSENAPAWFWHIFYFEFFVNPLMCKIKWMNSLLEGTSSPYWALTCKIPRLHLLSILKILDIRVIGGMRNHCLFSWGHVLYKVEYRNVEILQNVFSYAFDTVPDVARYINLQHSDQPTNIAVASWAKRCIEASYGVVWVH